MRQTAAHARLVKANMPKTAGKAKPVDLALNIPTQAVA